MHIAIARFPPVPAEHDNDFRDWFAWSNDQLRGAGEGRSSGWPAAEQHPPQRAAQEMARGGHRSGCFGACSSVSDQLAARLVPGQVRSDECFCCEGECHDNQWPVGDFVQGEGLKGS